MTLDLSVEELVAHRYAAGRRARGLATELKFAWLPEVRGASLCQGPR